MQGRSTMIIRIRRWFFAVFQIGFPEPERRPFSPNSYAPTVSDSGCAYQYRFVLRSVTIPQNVPFPHKTQRLVAGTPGVEAGEQQGWSA